MDTGIVLKLEKETLQSDNKQNLEHNVSRNEISKLWAWVCRTTNKKKSNRSGLFTCTGWGVDTMFYSYQWRPEPKNIYNICRRNLSETPLYWRNHWSYEAGWSQRTGIKIMGTNMVPTLWPWVSLFGNPGSTWWHGGVFQWLHLVTWRSSSPSLPGDLKVIFSETTWWR